MSRMLGLVAACLVVAVSTSHAQDPVPADSTARDIVTAMSIKSGKLALSTAANPGPVFLADGSYTNETRTVIVVLDGRIARIEYPSGTVTPVTSVRLQRERVMLMPPVSALMQVSAFPLPSGTFTSQDGAVTLKVVSGCPTELSIRRASP